MTDSPTPAHRADDGTFSNPWLPGGRANGPPGALLRGMRERRRQPGRANALSALDLPRAAPEIAQPRASRDELRVTWVGHATFLVQIGGINLLTDPIWSRRASPLRWLGPQRLTPPGVAFGDLPPIDVVLLSHDHYDHLDAPTIARLHARHGDALQWVTPLGYRHWFARRGIHNVAEMDWGEACDIGGATGGTARIACLPAQHWTGRGLRGRNRRLWASFAVAAGSRRLYFAGDTGYFGGFTCIGREHGPFDALLLPIGAYEPRWFMRAAHMNPEDAVQAYRDLGGRGTLAAMHWGTFRLTDEDPLEPPARTRAAWAAASLPAERLFIARHGETRVLPALNATENGPERRR